MAGDWIKMRSNLWDDPRVAKLCDATNSREATIIGALYWLWASADQHTETGVMPGLSLKQIDRKTGVKGFAQALCDIGWLEDNPSGAVIVHFEEHNGESAKKRAQTAKRVAKHKNGNAEVTQGALANSEKGNAVSVSSALPREREREEKEINNKFSGNDDDSTPNSVSVTVVAVADFTLADEICLNLEIEHGIPVEFTRDTFAEFQAFHVDNKPQTLSTWRSRFIQRVTDQWARKSKLRVVQP